MEEQNEVQVEQTEIVKGKTTFAPGHPTPLWAIWVFRTEFVLSKMLLLYLSGTSTVAAENMKEYVLKITVVDFGIWLFANSIGVKKKDVGLPEE